MSEPHVASLAADDLLITRLLLPPLRPALVERRRLRDSLRDGFAHALTLITAPAGSGKTTALVQAITAARARPAAPRFAWLALAEGDNDPVRFWRYLLAALERAAPGAWGRAEMILAATAGRPAEPLAVALLNSAAALESPVVLALDDYHLITTPEIHAGVALLADQAPAQLRLAIASRTIPPLPLERLRVRGRLAELRPADLRFTLAEAGALLGLLLDTPLPPAALADLVARTEGWGAGLILAALAARSHPHPERLAAAFGGASPTVLDYVTAEILAGLPSELRAFLLRTAALDRFSAELCDTMMDDGRWTVNAELQTVADGQQSPISGLRSTVLLTELERRNLFLVPLDDQGRWFRYHHLFAEALRAYAARNDPAALAESRLRAAAWFAARNAHTEAIRLALAGEAWEYAARLIAEVGQATLLRSEIATLQSWLAALPTTVRQAHPRLILLDAWVRVLLSDLEGAEAGAATAALADETLAGEAQMLQTTVAILRGGPGAPPPASPPDSPFLRTIALLNAGFLAQFAGAVPDAMTAFEAAAQSGQAAGNSLLTFIAWCQLGEVQILQGRPRAAQATYERALALMGGAQPTPFADAALVGLGIAAYEQGDLDQAAELIGAGLSRRSVLGDLAAVDGYLCLASIAALRGDATQAVAQLRAAEAVAHGLRVGVFSTVVSAEGARLAAHLGDLEAATAWLAASQADQDLPALLREIQALARAEVLYALGRPAETLALAAEIATAAHISGRGRHAAEAHILRARSLAGLARPAEAQAALEAARAIALPAGLTVIFLESVPVNTAPASPAGPDALTEREIEVLRLIAAGLSNHEIAARIVVAPSTVKKHINRIFAKLDAHSRTQAIVRARARGMVL